MEERFYEEHHLMRLWRYGENTSLIAEETLLRLYKWKLPQMSCDEAQKIAIETFGEVNQTSDLTPGFLIGFTKDGQVAYSSDSAKPVVTGIGETPESPDELAKLIEFEEQRGSNIVELFNDIPVKLPRVGIDGAYWEKRFKLGEY